jgi:hypothetical protein
MEYFQHNSYKSLQIEAAQLTCKIGCANCMQVRDRTLGPNLNYFPCFIHSGKPIIVDTAKQLEQAFREGELFIDNFAKEYGNDSPILIAEDKFVKKRSNSFFSTQLGLRELKETLGKEGFKQAKQLDFLLNYIRPKQPDDSWLNGEKCLKYGYDNHSSHKIEFIYSSFQSELVNGFIQEGSRAHGRFTDSQVEYFIGSFVLQQLFKGILDQTFGKYLRCIVRSRLFTVTPSKTVNERTRLIPH